MKYQRASVGCKRIRQAAGSGFFAAVKVGLCTGIVLFGATNATFAAPPWAEGQILVAPRAGLPERALERVLQNANARAVERIQGLTVRVVKVPPGQEERAVARLSRNPQVAFAELDRAEELAQTVPNDPNFSAAWHLAKMQVPGAWDVSTGTGVIVAILDTGVDGAHPDLAGNMLPGWNSVSLNEETGDINGHGTQVAGTVAALTNNGVGVASIAHQARILPVRVTNSGDGYAYWSDIARGLSWAADNGAKVANISYGASGSSSISNAAQALRSKGGIVVVAAGNTGADPGFQPNEYVVTVSATGTSDTRPSWSSFGAAVDFSAPGVGIWTTTRGGGYGAPSGTSFSSPAMAGVIAQMMGVNPALSPSQLEAILQQTVVDIGATGWDPYYGFGRVDAAAAVAMAYDSSPNDAEPPTVAITAPGIRAQVSAIVPVAVSAGDNYGVARVELYVDDLPYAVDDVAPYEFSWDAASHPGDAATLVAFATDEAGNRADSVPVAVTIVRDQDLVPPELDLRQPVDGAAVSGNVSMSASANDDVAMQQVAIYVDGRLKCAGTSSASCSWNTRKETAGSTHAVSAVATDTSGNTARASATVTIAGGGGGGGGGKDPDDGSTKPGRGKKK